MPQTLNLRLAARVASTTTGCRLHILSGEAVLALWRGGIADPERAMVAMPAGDVLCVGFRSTRGEMHLCVNRDAAPPDSYKRARLPFAVLDLSMVLGVIASPSHAAPGDPVQCAALYRDGCITLVEQCPRPGIVPAAFHARSQRMVD